MFKALIASTVGAFFIFICQLLIVPFLFFFGINSTATIRPVNPPQMTPTPVPMVTSEPSQFSRSVYPKPISYSPAPATQSTRT